VIHLVTTAGPSDGRGHLSRTVTMAEAFVEAGATVSVEILRGEPAAGDARRLAEAGVARRGHEAPGDDAVALIDLPDPNEAASEWPARRVAVFDDREWFLGPAAIVIQPSRASWTGSARAERVLAGYAYAPIRPSLRALARERAQRGTAAAAGGAAPPGSRTASAPGGSVVVCFGGSDPEDVGGRVAPSIVATSPWPVTVVVGPDYRGRLTEGEARVAADAELVRDPPDLDARLATAGIVVSGAGTMKFELAVLGRPAILLGVVDDQLPVGPPFAATGAARWVGDGRSVPPDEVGAAVVGLIAEPGARAAMAARGPEVVDGRGAERIAAEILELAGRVSADAR
jgi:spore coat polysaccharide biosynthesis predicted glycosyltransferase SpsG